MDCQRCYCEVAGYEITIEYPATLNITARFIESTPDRDWMDCQACVRVVCFHGCRHPASGFCDGCIVTYDLTAELIEHGLIPEEIYEQTTLYACGS